MRKLGQEKGVMSNRKRGGECEIFTTARFHKEMISREGKPHSRKKSMADVKTPWLISDYQNITPIPMIKVKENSIVKLTYNWCFKMFGS